MTEMSSTNLKIASVSLTRSFVLSPPSALTSVGSRIPFSVSSHSTLTRMLDNFLFYQQVFFVLFQASALQAIPLRLRIQVRLRSFDLKGI
jgi:hypothetical protein